MNKTIKSLIVSPDTQVRVNLKEAIVRIVGKCNIFFAKNCNEAERIIAEEQDVAAVFIRSDIDPQETTEFLNKIEDADLNYKPLYFITLHSDHIQTDYVSDYYLTGIEGFLKEPFTTEDVDRSIRLAIANRDREISDKEKELETLQFMLREGFSLLDEAALNRFERNGRGGGFALRRMKRLKMRLQAIKDNFEENEILKIIETKMHFAIKQLNISVFKKKSIQIVFAEHPGSIVNCILEERSLPTERLCELVQIQKDEVLDVLNESGPISPKIAKEFARVIGNTAEYWLSLQQKHDEYARSKGNT